MSPAEDLNEYNLTVEAVAEMFGRNARTIRRWANDGILPSRPRPLDADGKPKTRHIMFRRADIEQALREAGQAVPDSGRGNMSDTNPAGLLQEAEATRT